MRLPLLTNLILKKPYGGDTREKDIVMSPFVLVLLALVIVACVFGYTVYHRGAEQRAKEKKRNQYHDRI